MQFNTIDEAKEYVVAVTNKAKSLKEINSAISYYQKMVDNAHTDESRNFWLDELSKLNAWKDSDDFKQGNYPQGIDELVIELVEWRAIIYAFQHVDTKRNPFNESGFYAQWYLGAIYGVFTIIGKLVSKDIRDRSLRKLWEVVSPMMLDKGACTKTEVDYINSAMDKKSGRFTNGNSKALLFRNKLIAHNEAMPIVKWDEVDNDLSLLVRMWSLLVAWSSFGIFQPFRTDKQAFLGLESMYESLEIKALKEQRQCYLRMVEGWSKCYSHSGMEDPGRGAFSTLSVKVLPTRAEIT
jgi:hypothetical protein